LTRKCVSFNWSEECEALFLKLKEKLVTSPVLAYPNFKEDAGMFILDTDASDFTIGAILSQQHSDGMEKAIAYGNKSLQGGEVNYCTTRREMLALVTFVEHFNSDITC
jgi:hypothetical protein